MKIILLLTWLQSCQLREGTLVLLQDLQQLLVRMSFLALLEDMRVIELYISSITGVSDDMRFRALLQPIRELQQEQKKISAAVVNSEKKILAAVDELKALVSEQTRRASNLR